MRTELFSQQLEESIWRGLPLRDVVTALREYRSQGLSQQEAQQVLETLRERVQGDASEDRILEVMDIVGGFCSREWTVWD